VFIKVIQNRNEGVMKELQMASSINFIECYRIFLKQHTEKMFSDRILPQKTTPVSDRPSVSVQYSIRIMMIPLVTNFMEKLRGLCM
jgi:hypothetical protein